MNLAAHPRATTWLGVVSFAESSVFPVPPDTMLIPVALARPDQAWRLAAICTVTSVAGGARCFLLAALIRRFGPGVRDFIERPLVLVTAAVAVVLGVLALRLI